MKWAGICVGVLGLLIVIIGWRMDTYVPLPIDSQLVSAISRDGHLFVSNLQLMQRQQNTIIIGCVAFLTGVLLFGFGLVADSRHPDKKPQSDDAAKWMLKLAKQKRLSEELSVASVPDLHGGRVDRDGVPLKEKRWLGIYYYVRDPGNDEEVNVEKP